MTEDNITTQTSSAPAVGIQSSALVTTNTETEIGSASNSRSRNRRKKKKSGGSNSTETSKVTKTPTVIFKGDSPKMNGHVFQWTKGLNDQKQFSRTKEELIRWTQTNNKQEDSDTTRFIQLVLV